MEETDVMMEPVVDGLPDGWEWKRLDELTEINIGKTPPRAEPKHFQGDNIWVSIRDLKGKTVFDSAEKLTDDAVKRFNVRKVSAGTLLMSFKLTIGRLAIAGVDLHTNEAIAALPVKDEAVLDRDFLAYALSAIDLTEGGENAVKGVTLNKQSLAALQIPLPPLPEQHRIVQKLDALFARIDEAVALTEEALQHLGHLLPAALNEVFGEAEEKGWEKDVLRNLTTKIGSGATPSGGNKAYKASGISLIRSMNVYDEGFEMDGLAFIDDEQAAKLSNVTVGEDDVLLNITGASVARCCVVPSDVLPARVNQHVSILRVKREKLLPAFLHFALISPEIKNRLLHDSGGGATREAITKGMLESFAIQFPPLPTQHAIVAHLNALSEKSRALTAQHSEKLRHLKALKGSLLGAAFRGEL